MIKEAGLHQLMGPWVCFTLGKSHPRCSKLLWPAYSRHVLWYPPSCVGSLNSNTSEGVLYHHVCNVVTARDHRTPMSTTAQPQVWYCFYPQIYKLVAINSETEIMIWLFILFASANTNCSGIRKPTAILSCVENMAFPIHFQSNPPWSSCTGCSVVT